MADGLLKHTPLYSQHTLLGARLVEFAGWEMPLLYRGINEEHRHTREKCSVFDVSHMGRIELRGDEAEALLERICTRRVGDMQPGRLRYTHICNDRGGILDDAIVSRYETHWLLVCNGSNRERITDWLRTHADGRTVWMNDITEATAMLAIQGPMTMTLAKRLPFALADLGRYRFRAGQYMGMEYTVSHTGYTGEDGLEVILPAEAAAIGWEFLLTPPDEFEPPIVKPAGLGARDTLRIEAGLPLYGHELHEGTDSLRAGFGWCVDLSKEFIGADALRRLDPERLSPRLVGLELAGKRIARQAAAVTADGRHAGEVTSGTLSPALGKSIAMAYVEGDCAAPGTAVRVQLREGQDEDAVVVKLPFYRRATREERVKSSVFRV